MESVKYPSVPEDSSSAAPDRDVMMKSFLRGKSDDGKWKGIVVTKDEKEDKAIFFNVDSLKFRFDVARFVYDVESQ